MRPAIRKRWPLHTGALVVLGLVALMGVSGDHTAAQAPGPAPHLFFGSQDSGSGLRLDGAAAADGTAVRAERWDDRELVAAGVVDDGAWLVRVAPDLADQVVLTVEGFSAAGPFDVVSGAFTEVALDLLSNGDGAVTPSPATRLTYKAWRPRAIRSDRTDPVTLHLSFDGVPERAEVVLRSGRTLPADPTGGREASVVLSAADALSGYVPGQGHNLIGNVRLYLRGAVVVNPNLSINVLDAGLPAVPVTRLSPQVQVAPHVVNLRVDEPLLQRSQLPDLTQEFYAHFQDAFDFLVVLADVQSNVAPGFQLVRNDIDGLGLPRSHEGALFGSAGRLQGLIDYPIDTSFHPASRQSHRLIGKRWMNYLDTPILRGSEGDWPLSDLAFGILGPGGGATFPYQLGPRQDGRTTLISRGPAREFNDLELYLMGLIPPSAVGPHVVFVDQNQRVEVVAGTATLSGETVPITIDDILAVDGLRSPAPGAAQTDFRLATVILSRGRLLDANELLFFEHVAARAGATTERPYRIAGESGLTKPFAMATGGRARLDSLVSPFTRLPGAALSDPIVGTVLPARAFPGVQDLEVRIEGREFIGGVEVAFGHLGVTVTGLRLEGPAALVATIDVARDAAPGLIEVRILNGDGVPAARPAGFELVATRTLALRQGWNLVGWALDLPVSAAVSTIDGIFDQLLTYDAGAQRFLAFLPDLPFASALTDLRAGDGVWLHVTSARGATWTQPALTGALRLQLLGGWNLVLWAGPDGWPVAAAVAPLGARFEALFTWDPVAQAFRSHAAQLPASADGALLLQSGDGVWIRVREDLVWEHPPR